MLDLEGLELGSHLGKYLIRQELGRGGMGTVYLAEDSLLARDVAIKVMLPALGADPGFATQFREEARSVARLLHPGIVHINSFEWIDGRFVIDMEYVPGPSLECLLTGNSLTVHGLLAVVADVLQGLAACHEHGVVHRDVKPTNILTTSQGHAKLGDFGIAKAYATHLEAAISRQMSSGFYLGTPHYAPPELWEGAAPTPAWDVYSVGMVMYRALAGKLPYDGASPFAIVKQMQSCPVTPLKELAPTVSDELAACVHAMLEPDCAKRPADANTALTLLRAVSEAGEIHIHESLTIRIPQHALASHRGSKARRAVRRILPVAVALGILVAVLSSAYLFPAFLSDLGLSERAKTTPAASSALPSQDEAARTQLLSKPELLSHTKRAYGPGYLFFDTSILGTDIRHDLHWMMERPRAGLDSTVIAATDRSLWVLRMTPSATGKLLLEGNWAEYEDEAGTVFRQGTVSGKGMWGEGQALTALMRFQCSTDRSTLDLTIIATPHNAPVTDTQFLYALERAPLVQPLLYRELLERQSPWAEQVASLLPAVEGARLDVPFVGVPSKPVEVDGRFDEPLWKASYAFQDAGLTACPGVPLSSGATLQARCTSEGLLLGLRVPAASKAPPALEIAWCPVMAAPIENSPYALVRLPWRGAPTGHLVVEGRETQWDCDWRGVCAEVDGVRQWEIMAPLSRPPDLGEGDSLVPWRMNATVVEEGPNNSKRVVARWGFPELAEVMHGMQITVVRARESSGR